MNVLFLRTDFITLGVNSVWSTQKVDTLLKLVTLRLEDFKFIWNDIMAITTDGDGIMLKLGRLVQMQCEDIVANPSSARWRRPLMKNAAIELCRVQNIKV